MSTHFVLLREDVRIDGANVLSENVEIRTLPGGSPEASMAIDEGIFEVGFFAGRIQPTVAELDDLVSDFIAAVESVEGATATKREN